MPPCQLSGSSECARPNNESAALPNASVPSIAMNANGVAEAVFLHYDFGLGFEVWRLASNKGG